MLLVENKKAQVTIFILLAVLIVASAIFASFYFRSKIGPQSKINIVKDYLRDCVTSRTEEALKIAGLQGGYLDLPAKEEGSEYMPFSNHLNYLGLSVPYWFYVSGNNIRKEQKPSLEKIESQLKSYLEKEIIKCDFSSLILQGYEIKKETQPIVEVKIRDAFINIKLKWPLKVTFNEQQFDLNEQDIKLKSNFGLLYNAASSIFEAEQKNLFLENYGIDVLRLYAPVDGIEVSCAPKIWFKSIVEKELKSALEVNIGSIKIKGTNYKLANKQNKYFEFDLENSGKISSNINLFFLYNPLWPTKLDVWPSEDNIMRAEPIGTQRGLELLRGIGLCYVPYHFVYDLYFPVLIQISKGSELFQFVTLVIIDKNMPREANVSESSEFFFDICKYRNQETLIYTYNTKAEPIEAELFLKCFTQVCPVGKTTMKEGKASLLTQIPQCYNGFIIARAEGYGESKIIVPSIEEFVANVFLKQLYQLQIELPNLKSDEYALISFSSDSANNVIYYPLQKDITLSEGNYNLSVYVFKETNFNIGSQQGETCVRSPAGGIAGLFGKMQEQCYEINLPQQSITSVLFGGGKAHLQLSDSDFQSKSQLIIIPETYEVPKDMSDLEKIYTLIDIANVRVDLK